MSRLSEIANNISTGNSYKKDYKKKTSQHQWLGELLSEGYDGLCAGVKLHSIQNEYITYRHAARTMDKMALTIVHIYDKRIAELERKLDEYRADET